MRETLFNLITTNMSTMQKFEILSPKYNVHKSGITVPSCTHTQTNKQQQQQLKTSNDK